jgi:hypothetical protein
MYTGYWSGGINRRKPHGWAKSRVGDNITQDLKYFGRGKNGVDTCSSRKEQVIDSCVDDMSLRVS